MGASAPAAVAIQTDSISVWWPLGTGLPLNRGPFTIRPYVLGNVPYALYLLVASLAQRVRSPQHCCPRLELHSLLIRSSTHI